MTDRQGVKIKRLEEEVIRLKHQAAEIFKKGLDEYERRRCVDWAEEDWKHLEADTDSKHLEMFEAEVQLALARAGRVGDSDLDDDDISF
jgi:hypothetical protein